MSYNSLFLGTVAGFAASAFLVVSVLLPSPKPSEPRAIYERSTRGIRIYLATPRLRGLLALNLAAAAGGAMVLVNTVVLVRGELGLSESALAWTKGAFGAGSMLAARSRPGVGPAGHARRGGPTDGAAGGAGDDHPRDRPVLATPSRGLADLRHRLFGGAHPFRRLLRRSAHPEDRPAVVAAQFALSHACWLVTYPLAGS